MGALKEMDLEVHNEKKENSSFNKSGLGGWLVLPQIGLFLTALMLIYSILSLDVAFFNGEAWDKLSDQPGYRAYLMFSIIYNISMLVFTIFSIVQFYRKKAMLPRLMVILYSVAISISIIDLIMLPQLTFITDQEKKALITNLVRNMIAGGIWMPYFIKSKRVKNTFVA
jgi:hypothetical protein